MLIHAPLVKTWAIRTRGLSNLTLIISLSVRIEWDIQPNSIRVYVKGHRFLTFAKIWTKATWHHKEIVMDAFKTESTRAI